MTPLLPEAARILNLGLTKTNAFIASGELRSIKIGSARRVPADALHEFVQRLDQAQNGKRSRTRGCAA
ncbi:excisionase family DNA-binding protein [Streptomyces sp. NPDC005096]|uniref:excisionase family DNA-binding protein n=1 Tax=Streptomyces sp. NPDC005096 TaxID=3154559 RepID=UPI0033AB090F